MNRGVLGGLLRFSGASIPAKFAAVNPGNLHIQWTRFNNRPLLWNSLLSLRCHSSNSGKEVVNIERLDSEGSGKFVYDNFGRLRVFLKFLILQSVPIAFFAYCYCRFEDERLSLYSAPLESVDEVLRHLWSITRNALCFLLVDGKVYMVNYSVGNKIDFEGVDSAESFLNKLEQNPRDMLRNIYISYSGDLGIEGILKSSKQVDLLFYNQSLDSFASVRAGSRSIEDHELKKKLWTPRLGEETNRVVLLSTKYVRIGFGGSCKSVALENKEDWILSQ